MKVAATFLLLFLHAALSCRCPVLPSKDAFCRADWVSHVKVLYKMILPNNGLDDVLYIIQHIQTYKSPSGVHNMYSYVLTSSESSACGLVLDVGKEYLLSGTFYNGEYHTSTCFQVVTDDPADNFSGNLMEWKDVTSAFENRLHSFQC